MPGTFASLPCVWQAEDPRCFVEGVRRTGCGGAVFVCRHENPREVIFVGFDALFKEVEPGYRRRQLVAASRMACELVLDDRAGTAARVVFLTGLRRLMYFEVLIAQHGRTRMRIDIIDRIGRRGQGGKHERKGVYVHVDDAQRVVAKQSIFLEQIDRNGVFDGRGTHKLFIRNERLRPRAGDQPDLLTH